MTGYSPGVGRLLREQEVGGSNPLTPILFLDIDFPLIYILISQGRFMNDKERAKWNKLSSVRSDLMRNGYKYDDPTVVELKKQMDDIETGRPRAVIKIVRVEHKDYWYKNLIGEMMEVRESGKDDYMLLDFISNKKKNEELDCGCGYIFKLDCEIVK